MHAGVHFKKICIKMKQCFTYPDIGTSEIEFQKSAFQKRRQRRFYSAFHQIGRHRPFYKNPAGGTFLVFQM